jgi:hypothetical protein
VVVVVHKLADQLVVRAVQVVAGELINDYQTTANRVRPILDQAAAPVLIYQAATVVQEL